MEMMCERSIRLPPELVTMIVKSLVEMRGETHTTYVTDISVQTLSKSKESNVIKFNKRHARRNPRRTSTASGSTHVANATLPPTHLMIVFHSKNGRFDYTLLPYEIRQDHIMEIGVGARPPSTSDWSLPLRVGRTQVDEYDRPLLEDHDSRFFRLKLPVETLTDDVNTSTTSETAEEPNNAPVSLDKAYEICHQIMSYVGQTNFILLRTPGREKARKDRKQEEIALIEACVRNLEYGDSSAKKVTMTLLDMLARYPTSDHNGVHRQVSEEIWGPAEGEPPYSEETRAMNCHYRYGRARFRTRVGFQKRRVEGN